MNIVVCVKQVPESRDVSMDPETGSLIREGAAAVMNPYDLHALEGGVRLKEMYGGSVTVITMGPPQAEVVIKEAYMMGADRGILLSDRAFAGADTLATAFTLARGIEKVGNVDLILCGLQTTDGDTAQVGPGIAEFLGWPHEAGVHAVHHGEEGELWVQRDMGTEVMELSLSLPALITVTKKANQPRLLSYRRKQKTADWPVEVWTHKDILRSVSDSQGSFFGLMGSPTQVERIFQPHSNTERVIWNDSEANTAQQLFNLLIGGKYI